MRFQRILVLIALSTWPSRCAVAQDSLSPAHRALSAATSIGDAARSGQTALPKLPGGSLERLHAPFRENLNRLDPSRDGWATEAFSDRVGAQLKRLESIIAADQLDRAELEELVSPAFQCTTLRPDSLQTAFTDKVLTVQRGPNASDGRPATGGVVWKHRGAAGFAEAIDRLKASLRGMHVHVHFKTIRVDLDAAPPETVSVFQLGASAPHGGRQQTARWTCRWEEMKADEAPRLLSVEMTQFEETSASVPHGMFQDCTESVLGRAPSYRDQLRLGIDDWVPRLDRHLGIDIVAIHGLAIGDVNNDGLDDLFVCEPGGLPNRLYLHKPDGTLRDVSAVAGVDYLESTRSALLVDLDNDGDQDLVLAIDRFVVFLANDGLGRFEQRAGFRTPSVAVSMAAADYDLDGDLDVYVCGYFTMEDAAESSIGLGNPIPFHDANNGAKNTFYRNEGSFAFTDATDEVGLGRDNRRFTLAAAWEDYDRDSDPDLYVVNDYGRNCLYRNDSGHFTNVAAEAGVEDISAGMSASFGDFNRDGLLDIYVSNMFSSAGNRISYQRQFKRGADEDVIRDYQRFARGNSLFENAGDGTFHDVTLEANVTMGRWAWGSNFVDINNDGWQDLVVANGMLTRESDTGDL